MRILLDAMGGDNAPDANIKGAVKAINQVKAEVILIGNEEVINSRIKELFGKNNVKEISDRLSIKHTTETIEMEDIPTQAIKHKKDSSMVVGFKMLKEEIENRKKLFSEFGGSYESYIKNSGKVIPNIVVIINLYEAFDEMYPDLSEDFNSLTREGLKYGVIFILSTNGFE